MTLIMAIVAYVMGIWITLFAFGLMDGLGDQVDEIEFLLSIFWPLCLVATIYLQICDFVCWVWHKVPKREKIECWISKMLLVFQPFVLGKKLNNWLDNRKKTCKNEQ